jgi:hypothetical protein
MAERASQVVAEVAADGEGSRVSQSAVEVVASGSGSRVSQSAVELMALPVANTRVPQVVVELMTFTPDGVRVFINDEEVEPLWPSFEIRETANGISTLRCDVAHYANTSPVYRPSIHDEVIVREDGVRIFAGYITQVRERGFGGPNLYSADGHEQIVNEIGASDYSQLAQRRYVTVTIADGSPATTLHDFLSDLVDDYFDDYGVSLDASQDTGPNLEPAAFTNVVGTNVLNQVAESLGRVWRIDYNKKLRMWEPGDLTAPIDIDEDDDPAKWTGDVEVERIASSLYANKVTVLSELITDHARTDTFTGDGLEDTFTLSYDPIGTRGYVTNAGVDETLGTGATWEIDFDAGTITRTAGAPANGAAISITYSGTFQANETAQDAGEIALFGVWEYQEQASNITEPSAAQALADSILAERLNSSDLTVTYETRYKAPQIRAGQVQTIAADAREISGDLMITDMTIRAEAPVDEATAEYGLGLIRTVTCRRNQTLGGDWRQTYRDWGNA